MNNHDFGFLLLISPGFYRERAWGGWPTWTVRLSTEFRIEARFVATGEWRWLRFGLGPLSIEFVQ